MRQASKRLISLVLLALATGHVGCRSLQLSSVHAPCSAEPLDCQTFLDATDAQLKRAAQLEAAGEAGCVDAYFSAARLAREVIGESNARHYYNEATCGLIFAAQRFGRLDPARGLVIQEAGRESVIPVVHHGFAWNAEDFQHLHPPPTRHEPLLSRRYCCQGWGVPLVIERRRCDGDPIEARLFPERAFFSATAVLRFGGASPSLEFHNPHLARDIAIEVSPLPLAADLSASLAATLEVAPRTYFAGFIEPGRATTTSRLTILEPYQPGKVPVLLIHGLFSDPLSWADLVNDLRATPGFTDHFQIWVFRYPTGQGFRNRPRRCGQSCGPR